MAITPVTVLAGPAGSAAGWLHAWQLEPRFAGTLVVRDGGAPAPEGSCACCAANDGLTRELRGLAYARAAGAASFERILVDATGGDPRPAIAALARTPLASLRLGLSAVLATDASDALAMGLADELVDRASGPEAIVRRGLYAGGVLEAGGWVERVAGPHLAWSREEPCRWEDVESALQALQLAAPGLLRAKALVEVAGEPGPRLAQVFGHTRYPSARLPGFPGAARGTRLTVVAGPLESTRIARILQEIPCPIP